MTFTPTSLLITGGAGFIGSSTVRRAVAAGVSKIVVLDALTYAGHRINLGDVMSAVTFVHGNICDAALVNGLFAQHAFDSVIHLAAETHVDRSIESAAEFVQTNVVGTLTLLDASMRAWAAPNANTERRFVHVSTDEVYGSLGPTGHFTESTAYAPNSPYAASKASSDLLVRSFHRTYGLPTVVTNTCNNYGPRQLPEKLIPLMIAHALSGKKLPVYGKGAQVREWLHVDDHADSLWLALTQGAAGESYNFGSGEETDNLRMVERLADTVDEVSGNPKGMSRALITFVEDRKGHDFRYAIDSSKAKAAFGWQPKRTLAHDLRAVVEWYRDNEEWCRLVSSDEHSRFQAAYYKDREGTGGAK